jgi:NCAIR mutase (PurE)-related protein
MDAERLQALLTAVHAGEVGVAEAVAALRTMPVDSLGYARLDTHRAVRTGFPEVVFCPGKTPEQIVGILSRLREHHDRVLATRCEPAVAEVVRAALPDLAWHPLPRLLTWGYAAPEAPGAGRVAVLAAGTADLSVAEEAAMTAELAGVCVERVWDVGVAGLHRVLAARPHLEAADAVVVVAGMEGALASVVGGLTDRPVIAVPTSVGYGASFGGLAALLTMLNGCAAGVAVMNIDNGFGAGHLAARIARRARGGP